MSGKLMHFRPENGIYVMFRYDETDSAMLVLNKNPDDVSLDLKRFQERLNGFHSAQDVLTGEVLSLGDALLLPSRAPLILDLLKD